MSDDATSAIKAFAALLANSDENARSAYISRAKVLAMQAADPVAFEPPVRTLGEYLDTPIPVPPVLVEPCLLVRGGVLCTVGRAGKGKRVGEDTEVCTVDGWRRVDTLQVGDALIDPDGGHSKVTGVFPSGVQKAYRVRFSDGTSVVCGPEHRWCVKKRNRGKGKVLELQEFMHNLRDSRDDALWFVPVTKPCEYPEQPRAVHPYILGILLGDGGFSNGNVNFVTGDAEVSARIARLLPDDCSLRSCGQHPLRTRILGASQGTPNPVITELRRLGLWGLTGPDKFVPAECLTWPIEQRQELLAGLMDADGGRHGTGAYFWSSSKALAEGVAALVRSLGGIAKLSYRASRGEVDINGVTVNSNRVQHIVTVIARDNPFKLRRKADGWKQSRRLSKAIVSVERTVDQKCRCISTSAQRGLFLVDGYTVTSNTQVNLNRLMKWSVGRPLFEGLHTRDETPVLGPNGPLRTLMIENEGAAGMFHRQVGIMLNAQGWLTDEERKLARENIMVWGDGGWSGLKLDDEAQLNMVRSACEKHKPDILFIEPFRGLWKGEENSATDMATVVDALNGIAADYDCGVILTHHERKSGIGEDGEKMSAGRGSTVLEGAVATMENFEVAKGGDFRELSWSKVRYGGGQPLLPIRMEWQYKDWWYRHVPLAEIEDMILNELAAVDPEAMTVRDLMESTQEKEHTIRRTLKELCAGEHPKVNSSKSSEPGAGKRYRLARPTTENGETMGF